MADTVIPSQPPPSPEPRTPEEYETFYLHARFVTGLAFYPAICVFGIVGNCMGLVVMAQRQMRSSTNVYLFSLALVDLLKLLCDFLYFMVILLLQVAPASGNMAYGLIYPYAHYVFNTSLCISAWLIVSVAVERYISVCHPLKLKVFCNIKRAKIISVSVYVVMSVFAIPYILRYKTVQTRGVDSGEIKYDISVTPLWQNETFAAAFTWTQNLMRSIIPLTLLIILNTSIVYGLRRCRSLRSKPPKKHKITRMLTVVIAVFLVCVTPDAIMSTFCGFGYFEESYLARGIREITDLLLLINSAVNFIIYCIFNSVFWNHFRRMFCSLCRKRDGVLTEAWQCSTFNFRSTVNTRSRIEINSVDKIKIDV